MYKKTQTIYNKLTNTELDIVARIMAAIVNLPEIDGELLGSMAYRLLNLTETDLHKILIQRDSVSQATTMTINNEWRNFNRNN